MELLFRTLVLLSLLTWLSVLTIYLFGLRSGRRAVRPWSREADRPTVSLLKPIAGVDDDLASNLASFATQTWPGLEILLGQAHGDHAADAQIASFIAANPHLSIRTIRTDPHAALNPKVAQLVGLSRAARGDVLLISDANVRVEPDYVAHLVAALSEPGVGLVSSVVHGDGEETWGAALENLQINAQIAPLLVFFDVVGGPTVALGKSMAVHRATIEAAGGFETFGEVLAEDFALAAHVERRGLEVVLVRDRGVVNRNVSAGFERTLERHTRWAKMRRAITPAPFYFEPLLYPSVVAGALFLATGAWRDLELLGLVLALQALVGWSVSGIVRGHPMALRYLLLEPLRVALLQVCWARAVVSRRTSWRGHAMLIEAGSRIRPVDDGFELPALTMPSELEQVLAATRFEAEPERAVL